VAPTLDLNTAKSNHDDGWDGNKEMRRVGSIPLNTIQDFKKKGIDLLRPDKDPKKFAQIMNDSDFRKLRSAHWKV